MRIPDHREEAGWNVRCEYGACKVEKRGFMQALYAYRACQSPPGKGMGDWERGSPGLIGDKDERL